MTTAGTQGAMADTTAKLTKRVVDAAIVRPARYVIRDAELPGFGVRIGAGGTRSVILHYRPKGSGRSCARRFVTIGRCGALTARDARARTFHA